MPYYAGDWYRGDYYMGDPGIGSFFKNIGGLFRGRPKPPGPARLGTGTVAGSIAAAGAASVGLVRSVRGAIIGHPALSAAGAAGIVGAVAGGAAVRGVRPRPALEIPGPGMRGFHISRRTGALVRNRRMRVTNPKALRRAIRRATGFARLAKRVLRFTSPRAPRGRAVFKHRRRAAARRI